MKEKLTVSEYVLIASMLFGMFFGAGNLIFPVYMGQAAGAEMWAAIGGFLITGVGIPLLAVAALGMSHSSGLMEMSSHVGHGYGLFFTCLLYLSIGPFFAVPRCASVPFTVAIQSLLPDGASLTLPQLAFTFVFFALVLALSLKPGKIMTWIGKILNPIFLASLGILLVKAILVPMGRVGEIVPDPSYAGKAFFTGFLEGYNTLDALAGLAFGIVVINVVKGLGVEKPEAIAKNTVLAGVFSCALMGVIYIAVTLMGARSRGALPLYSNGGEALAAIAGFYYGSVGGLILALIVTFACLKTAVGLLTSCSETFVGLFPKGPSYKLWCIIFAVFSFVVSNVGLTAIIAYAVPALMFLYPLAITLILMSLCSKWFDGRREVYISVTVFTFAAALLDLIKALPGQLGMSGLMAAASAYLPLFDLGLGWICPALLGLVVGLVLKTVRK